MKDLLPEHIMSLEWDQLELKKPRLILLLLVGCTLHRVEKMNCLEILSMLQSVTTLGDPEVLSSVNVCLVR